MTLFGIDSYISFCTLVFIGLRILNVFLDVGKN